MEAPLIDQLNELNIVREYNNKIIPSGWAMHPITFLELEKEFAAIGFPDGKTYLNVPYKTTQDLPIGVIYAEYGGKKFHYLKDGPNDVKELGVLFMSEAELIIRHEVDYTEEETMIKPYLTPSRGKPVVFFEDMVAAMLRLYKNKKLSRSKLTEILSEIAYRHFKSDSLLFARWLNNHWWEAEGADPNLWIKKGSRWEGGVVKETKTIEELYAMFKKESANA